MVKMPASDGSADGGNVRRAVYNAIDAALKAAGFQVLGSLPYVEGGYGLTEYASALWNAAEPQDDKPHIYLDTDLCLCGLWGGYQHGEWASEDMVLDIPLDGGDIYIAANGEQGWFWYGFKKNPDAGLVWGLTRIKRYPSDMNEGLAARYAIFSQGALQIAWATDTTGARYNFPEADQCSPLQGHGKADVGIESPNRHVVAPVFARLRDPAAMIPAVFGEMEDILATGAGHGFMAEVIKGWLCFTTQQGAATLVRKPTSFDRQPDAT
ncbi:MAG: hypothetical protein ACOZAP_04510 [Pseudomonadota bacterium]